MLLPPPNAMVITVLPVAPNVAAIVHLLLRPPRKFIGLKRNDTDMLSHSKIVLLCDQKPQNQQLVDKLVSRCHFCAQCSALSRWKLKRPSLIPTAAEGWDEKGISTRGGGRWSKGRRGEGREGQHRKIRQLSTKVTDISKTRVEGRRWSVETT